MSTALKNRLNEHLRGVAGDTAVYNAFEIKSNNLSWEVRAYRVTKCDRPNTPEGRRKMEKVLWDSRKDHKETCPSYGFILAYDDNTVLIPTAWQLPDQENYAGYRIEQADTFTLDANNPTHEGVVRELIKRGVREHLKQGDFEELGPLWQDYGAFCESPTLKDATGDTVYCRRFEVIPERLAGNRWVLKVHLNTVSVDVRSFADYYRAGEVETLADYIRRKRDNRTTRKNTSTAIRVLEIGSNASDVKVRDLSNPELIQEHAALSQEEQQQMASGTADCSNFPRHNMPVALSRLYLILDTQITGEDHSETILGPSTRESWFYRIREVVDGAEAYGATLELAPDLFRIPQERQLTILPPAIDLKGKNGEPFTLKAPTMASPEALRKRVRARNKHVRENGHLIERPINPLLVYPSRLSESRAERMRSDLSMLAKQQGLDITIGGPKRYMNEDEIVKEVEQTGYDSVIAALPEGASAKQHSGDTHERIKKALSVESQCIHFDKTLHQRFLETSWEDLDKLPQWEGRKARAARSSYQAVLNNLLAKKGFIPFFPAEPFHFNVHVGIDVGGVHNNVVAVCVGYGLSTGYPIFLPEKLKLNEAQVEPIPPNALAEGLLSVFMKIAQPFLDRGIQPDFSRVLFFRDGDIKGQGEDWHESDAFDLLFEGLRQRNLLEGPSTWAVAEISKRAKYLRQFWQRSGRLTNPLVGQVTFPFDDETTALVSTTGEPYLPQGSAAPLLVRMTPIRGDLDREAVLIDLMWEADMCFTKLDTGMSLPFVLHVADQGALQTSRLYEYSGITL